MDRRGYKSGARDRFAALGRSKRLRYVLLRGVLAIAMFVANLVGAAIVFVVIRFVLPLPPIDADRGYVTRLNAYVLAGYLAFALPAGLLWSIRQSDEVRRWWLSGEDADPAMQKRVLDLPRRLVVIQVVLWLIAVVLFTTINAQFSLELALDVCLAVLLSAMATWGVAYLLAERIMRPLAAGSLESGSTDQTHVPGVTLRLLLTWGLTTGMPVVGLVLVGGGQVIGLFDDASAERLAITMLVLGGVALSVGLLATALVARSLADPIVSLRKALRQVRAGDLQAHTPVYDGSEVGLLQAGFNEMVEGLRERELLSDLFGRQVGQDVARQALERGVQLGGEVRAVAVLFVDIIGSTDLAAHRPAEEVVALLNRFFAVVVDVTATHGGMVNKFVGDAALCVFGAPLDHPDPEGAALSSGRALRDRLRDEVPELAAAIGVAAGPAVAGNVGAASRFEYTVIGDPVNEAARLTELAKTRPGRLVASAVALGRAPSAEQARWLTDEDVVLRGRAEPTTLAVPRDTSPG